MARNGHQRALNQLSKCFFAYFICCTALACPLDNSHWGNIWCVRIRQLSKDFSDTFYVSFSNLTFGSIFSGKLFLLNWGPGEKEKGRKATYIGKGDNYDCLSRPEGPSFHEWCHPEALYDILSAIKNLEYSKEIIQILNGRSRVGHRGYLLSWSQTEKSIWIMTRNGSIQHPVWETSNRVLQ